MFIAILSRTWWSSLKKGDASRPAEGQSLEEGGEQSDDSQIDESINLAPEDIATEEQARPAAPSSRRNSGGEGGRDRRHSESRSHEGRSSDSRGSDSRGENTRSESHRSEGNRGEEDLGDEDEVDTHMGEDPLAPAFELDDERPSRGGRRGGGEGRQPVFKSRIQSAKEFFATELLYRFDLLEGETREKLSGSYRLEVKGNKGGIWTMTVGNELDVVNRREEADVVLTFQHRDFIAIVNGDINPQLSVLAQKMKYTGDVAKVVQVQSLLSPMAE